MISAHLSATRSARRGVTLLEVMVVMTIMGVMLAMPSPRYFRAVEQSKLDVAAGNLRAIWGAQRFYYLEYGEFGTLDQLAPDPDPSAAPSAAHAALIEPTIASGATFYVYTISADGLSATAQHPDNARCNGSITIDQNGTLTCGVTYAGAAMSPSLEPNP